VPTSYSRSCRVGRTTRKAPRLPSLHRAGTRSDRRRSVSIQPCLFLKLVLPASSRVKLPGREIVQELVRVTILDTARQLLGVSKRWRGRQHQHQQKGGTAAKRSDLHGGAGWIGKHGKWAKAIVPWVNKVLAVSVTTEEERTKVLKDWDNIWVGVGNFFKADEVKQAHKDNQKAKEKNLKEPVLGRRTLLDNTFFDLKSATDEAELEVAVVVNALKLAPVQKKNKKKRKKKKGKTKKKKKGKKPSFINRRKKNP